MSDADSAIIALHRRPGPRLVLGHRGSAGSLDAGPLHTADNPEAVRALVQPDRVHRDLYIDAEICSSSSRSTSSPTPGTTSATTARCRSPATTSRNEIAGRPLIVVRHTDGSVRVMMNRCAHKGSRLVSAPCGNTGKFFRCPYHAWTFKTDGSLLAIPLKNGYEGTRLQRMRVGQGPGDA